VGNGLDKIVGRGRWEVMMDFVKEESEGLI
jgi:hypothetical protein